MRPSCQGLSSSVDGGREAKGWAPAEAALLLEEGLGPLQEETVPTPLQRRRCCPRSRPGLALTPPASSPQGRKLLGPLHFGPVLSPPPLPAQLCTLSRPPPGDPACPCHHEPDLGRAGFLGKRVRGVPGGRRKGRACAGGVGAPGNSHEAGKGGLEHRHWEGPWGVARGPERGRHTGQAALRGCDRGQAFRASPSLRAHLLPNPRTAGSLPPKHLPWA